MSIAITNKIVGYRVKKSEESAAPAEPVDQRPLPVEMNERVERPDTLLGSTYKIKPPVADHAMYITINDIVLNAGTDHEVRRPYEIFINSKAMSQFQWITGLTMVLSAVFRKGGDVAFLVEELRSVYDPNGGYFKKGGQFMPSLVAEIGAVLEQHLKSIGLLKSEALSEEAKAIIAQKRAQFEAQQAASETPATGSDYPASATVCKACQTKAVVLMDGCQTCLECGDGKCL